MTPLEVAFDYIGRGWSPIPVRFRGKKPLHDDWSKLRITRETAARYFNGAQLNVGVLMGEASGGLADVDLDCLEALALAARFLPPTGSVFGRKGKPGSHRLFTSAVPKTVQFQDPDDGGMLLELRSTGGQTVFPPSIHESGEHIDWTGFDEPMQVDQVRLASAASDLAVACLLVRAAPAENRHQFLLDIAGALIRAHRNAAGRIHHAVAQRILGDRYNKAEGERLLDETATRIAREDPACGWPRLVERIGEKRARSVAHWLSFVPGEERPHRRGTAAQPNEWPDPGELPSGLPAVEPFDPVMLPARLRPWVEDIALRMQAPLDYAAIGAMTCLGAAVGRRIAIRPKEHDDWTVVPNLWAAIIGRPAMMKSPTLKEITRPLVHLEMIAKEQHATAMEDHEEQQRLAKAQKKVDDENILKALRKGRTETAESIAGDGPRENDPPARRRYIVTNTTIEAMGIVLAANPGGVLLHRDELVGFFRSMDREGHQEDRSFYLEAWAGDSRYSHDRIGRGVLDIEACCISLLGGIQPGPLASYLQAMARGGEGDDGLIQRLQLMVWPEIPKGWCNVDRAPDLTARRDVVKLFEGVEDIIARAKTMVPTPEELEPGQHKAEETEEEPKRPRAAIPYLRFDWEAQRAFNAWREKLELRLRDDSLHPALEAHLAKYRSLIPSLALLFHIADARPDTELGPVGVEAFDAAEAWADYLESHAKRVYDSVIRSDMWAARVLGQHIRKGDLPSPFTLRDVYRPCWAGLDGLGAAEAAVEILIDLGWLGLEDPTRGSQGGRPSPKYHVNPKVMGAPT